MGRGLGRGVLRAGFTTEPTTNGFSDNDGGESKGFGGGKGFGSGGGFGGGSGRSFSS